MSCDVGEATELVGGRGSAHSPTLPSLHLHHSLISSLANPSVASFTSHLILQPLRRFTYVTSHSPIHPSLHLHHRHFTYVIWRAALALKHLQHYFQSPESCGNNVNSCFKSEFADPGLVFKGRRQQKPLFIKKIYKYDYEKDILISRNSLKY